MSDLKEFQRLRKEFEERASEYHDLTLVLHFIIKDVQQESIEFRSPNHVISLWQYMGDFTNVSTPHSIEAMNPTRFGLSGAEVSCYGVVEGDKTELFVRMAHRAGSLISSEVYDAIMSNVISNLTPSTGEGKPVFVCNPNPLAVWLDLILTFTQTIQPNRYRDRRLTVNLFVASLSAVDYVIDTMSQVTSLNTNNQTNAERGKRFRVALSFPGEKRAFVEEVANHLSERIGRPKLFYDNFYKAELAKPNLDAHLQHIYHKDSDLVVVFLCAEYEKKEWCGLEWRAVRDMIKQRRDDEIMLLRFDNAEITGVFSIDGYIDVNKFTTLEVADFVCQRLEML